MNLYTFEHKQTKEIRQVQATTEGQARTYLKDFAASIYKLLSVE